MAQHGLPESARASGNLCEKYMLSFVIYFSVNSNCFFTSSCVDIHVFMLFLYVPSGVRGTGLGLAKSFFIRPCPGPIAISNLVLFTAIFIKRNLRNT